MPSRRATDYDEAIRQKTAGGRVGRGALLRAGARGPDAGRRPLPARSTTRRTASTAGCRWRSRPCWPTTRRAPSPQAKELHARAERPNLFIKIPGTPRRPARHRGGDLRRGAGQRDAALLARALRRRRGRLHARHRAPHRRRAQSRRALGGLGVHQPLGQGGDGKVPEELHDQLGHRGRQAHLPGLPRPARLAPLPAPRQRRRPPAAAPLGEHRHQGPGGLRHPLRQVLAAPYTVNTMPEATLWPSPTTARSARCCRPTAATPRRCWPGSSRPASTSSRWPPSSSARAPTPSSIPGTS